MSLTQLVALSVCLISVLSLNFARGSDTSNVNVNVTRDFECSVGDGDFPGFSRNDLILSSPYYGILSEAETRLSSESECFRDIARILDGIQSREVWALKIHDASGMPGSNFIFGQNYWYGSEKACKRLNGELANPLALNTEMNLTTLFLSKAPFLTNYAVVYANYSSPYQFPFLYYVKVPIELGLCLPSSCNTADIFNISQSFFNKKALVFQKVYDLDIEVVEVKTLSWPRFFKRSDVQTILAGLAAGIIVVLFFNVIPKGEQESTLCRIQTCFDLSQNYKDLTSTKVSESAIRIVDSMRVIACFLIMGGHMFFFSLFTYSNGSEFLFTIFQFSKQVLLMCVAYVDVFFVISAFLMVYNFIRNEKQMEQIRTNSFGQNLKLYLKQVVHRYLRLTPAILLTVGLSHLIAVYLKETTMYYIPENMDLYCPNNNWWRNLLYVQAYYPAEEMCGTWTWYLSCDMHYFLICLTGLFIYASHPKVAKSLFFILSGASIAISWYINQSVNFKFHIDQAIALKDVVYTPPWVRMNPYFPGVAGGYLFYKFKSTGLKVKPYVDYLWYAASIGLFGSLFVFLYYQKDIAGAGWYFQQSFGRYLLGSYFAASIFIHYFGNGGLVRKLLAHKAFHHLNKLTYMAYLLDPIVVSLIQGIQNQPNLLENSRLYVDMISAAFFCYIASIVCTLFFEVPYSRLSAEFVMKKSKNTKTNS